MVPNGVEFGTLADQTTTLNRSLLHGCGLFAGCFGRVVGLPARCGSRFDTGGWHSAGSLAGRAALSRRVGRSRDGGNRCPASRVQPPPVTRQDIRGLDMLVAHLLPSWMPEGAEFEPRCWCWNYLDCDGVDRPGVYVPQLGYYCWACAARYWRPERDE